LKEIFDIIKAFHKASSERTRTALATVVKVEGSSYRQAGARMLITETGQLTGAISGGCLEGDALRRALLAIDQQRNKLVTYDTSSEDDVEFGIQLGCNGIVHILFEPIDPGDLSNPISLLEHIVKERSDAVLVTLFSQDRKNDQLGTVFLFKGQSEKSRLPNPSSVKQVSNEVFETQRSTVRQIEFNGVITESLFEFIPPSIRVVIAGAGNDVKPLVSMASLLGWETIVADGRKTHATVKRFPSAAQVIVAKPLALSESISFDRNTVLLLMTHNYNYDLELLHIMLLRPFAYIGVLGPKKKFERMADDLSKSSVFITEDQLERIFAPVGHDIGAETSEEIAVSIVAEIKAVFSNKLGTSLKFKQGQIHI